jgi:hypothetical protein
MTQLSEQLIHKAVVDVFKKHGFGPFDLEAIIHFAVVPFEPTPFTYLVLANRVREYIVVHFECRKGSLKLGKEMSLHRTLVYYRE